MTAERARARALADFQSLDLTSPGVPPELAARRQTIYRELAARRFRLTAALDRNGTEDARVRVIRSDIATLRRELDEIDARIGAASGTSHAQQLREGHSEPLNVRSLAGDSVLIEYWLGAADAFVWAADSDGVVMSRLEPPGTLTDAARAFHTALRGFGSVPQSERVNRGAQLYELLLKPLGARLLERRKLIFVPDGALHYVPFAALRINQPERAQFLVESHDIVVAPSLSMFLRARSARSRVAPTRQMLLVADPVYALSDARLARLAKNTPASERKPDSTLFSLLRGAEGEMDLARLPGSAQEAATIAALLPKESVDRLEGFTATRDRFLKAGLEHYRFIHIASHAVTDAEIPQASALILSKFDSRSQQIDGNVLAADFMHLQLNAQAVVLSACDTALGKNIAGEGLIGLRYVVLARGAESVVSSLWPVSDQATAQVMAHFYSLLLRNNSHVEVAFSEAMRTMIRGSFKDPGLWGAFALTMSGSQAD
jgi:CHAT domain-containing protein